MLVFVVYFISTPFIDSLIYLSCDINTKFYSRIFLILFTIFYVTLIFIVHYMSGLITKHAYMSRPLLHSCLTRMRLHVKHRLKIMAFNEQLSGHDIGFYCWNWFPLTVYEFYKFCFGLVYFYLLVL